MNSSVPDCFTKQFLTRLGLFTLLFLGIGQTKGFSQIYKFTNDSTGMYNSKNANVTATALGLGSGVKHDNYSPCGPTDGLGTDGWPTTNTFNINTFNANGHYITFTITPNMGYGLKITGFSTRSRRENLTGTADDGPIAMRYAYSTDGGANWTSVNPGNPQGSNLCASGGVLRAWPSWVNLNVSGAIIFRVYGLSSGTSFKGDLFLRDVVVDGEVCANAPNIVLGASPVSCFSNSATSVVLPYTFSDGVEYKLSIPGLGINTSYASLPASPIGFTIPAATPAGNYPGTVTVRNTCGFEDPTPATFSVTVNALPTPSIAVTETSGAANNDAIICNGASATLSASGGVSYVWSTMANTSAISVSPGATTTYTVTVTNMEGCTATATQVITVQPVTATANAGSDQVLGCDYGSVLLSGTIGGTANSGTWSSSIMGGAFDPDQNSLSTLYTPPSGNTTPFTLTLTTDGVCPASDAMEVTYGSLDPLVLTVTGPANATCGDVIQFNIVSSSGFTNLTSLQYLVDWDETNWSYVGATAVVIGSGSAMLGTGNTSSGQLAYSWISTGGETLPANSVILTLTLKAINSTGTTGVSIVGDMVIPIEAVNTHFCFLDVNTTPSSINLNPISVTCPNNQSVCLNGSSFVLSGGLPAGGNYSGTGVLMNSFDPGIAGVGTHTITYSYTDANNCSNSCTFEINVKPLPAASISFSPANICPGSPVQITFNESNFPNGTGFTLVATQTDNNHMGTSLGPLTGLVNGGTLNWTEGVEFGGDLSISNIVVTEPISGCSNAASNAALNVYDAPTFGFSAASEADGPHAGNNTSGPSTLDVNFCTGQHLTLANYSDNGNIGYSASYTSSGNLTYDGGAIPVSSGPTNISPAAAAGFFGFVYGGAGGYGLASGTYGTINQTFVPYLDNDNSGTLSAGDCVGAPMYLNYHVYAAPVVTVTRNVNNICSGEAVDYTISTNASQNVLFDLTLSEATNVGNPADLDDDNILPVVLTGLSLNDLSPYNFTHIINNAAGKFDRGRVALAISNVHYANANVCTATINNVNPNTQVYPKPRLAAPVDKIICSGNSTNLDIDLDPSSLPSANAANAGYGVRIDWTVSAPGITGASNGNVVIYNNSGVEVAVNDIVQALSLNVPANGPKTATYTLTPRSVAAGGGYNANDCFGDPITIIVTVVPPSTPTISGPTCVQVNAQMQLTGSDNVMLPAHVLTTAWSTDGSGHATVDANGLVSGVSVGQTTVYFTVTDDAGCASTASYVVNVLGPLTLTHVYTNGPVTCGDEFTVSVEVSNFCDINGLDYPFTWDENAFQLVSFNTPTQPLNGTFDAFTGGPGELYLAFYDDGYPPFGHDLSDGTVVLTYTLRAIGPSSPPNYNFPDVLPVAEASNGSFQNFLVSTVGISVPIAPISVTLLGNPEVCPSDDYAHLQFQDATGNPNYYVIDFDGCPGFPNILEGTLVVSDGEILIPLPNNMQHGSCNATLVVSNEYGCVSDEIPFSIIIDQIPPMVPTPAPLNFACVSSIPAPNTNVVVGETDNCSDIEHLTVAYQPGLSTQTGTGCPGSPMVINRVYSVTDEAGNTTYVTQTITAVDNVAPTVSTTGLATWYPSLAAAEAAALARANATKTDNCTPPVGILVSLASASSPTTGCGWTIHVAVSDACGNLIIANYNTIVDVAAPTVTAGLIDDCYDEAEVPVAPYYGFAYAVQAAISATTATDDCDANLTISAVVSGTDCETVIVVTATDDCGKSNSVTYHTRVENDAPIIYPYNTLALDGDCYTTEAEAIAAALAATTAGDDCTAPDDLQYDAFVGGGCPAEVTVVVTDYCGNPAMITYTGVYIDTEDPTVDPFEGYTTCFKTFAEAYAYLAGQANASDNCTATEDLVVTHAQVEVAPTGDACHIYDITLTFTDHCGRSTSAVFYNITIDNVAPTFVSASESSSYTCLDDVPPADVDGVTASDDCDGPVTVEFVSNTLPSACPGTYTRTYKLIDCAGNETLAVLQISINDDVPPTWVTTPSNNLNRTFQCGDDISAALALVPEAQDNCGEVTITLVSDVTAGGCTGLNRTRTWSAKDDCGNFAATNFTQVISVVDNIAPTWSTAAAALDRTVECSDPAALSAAQALKPTASDVCDQTPTLTKTSGTFVPGMGCPQAGTITNTWKAVDDCGNTSTTYTQVITIVDTHGPTWTTPQGVPYPNGLDVTISCSDLAAYNFANNLAPTATDLCDPSVSLIKTTGTFVPGQTCIGEGSFTNTWIAVDDCSNSSTVFTQTIHVIDNTPPTFNLACQFMPLNLFTSPDGGPAADCHAGISLQVGDVLNYLSTWTVAGVPIPSLSGCISDNCSPVESLVITVVSITEQTGLTVQISPNYTAQCVRRITVSFQLKDACGNVQPQLFTCVYNIIDNTAPLMFCNNGPEGGPSLPQDCYPTVAAAQADALELVSPCDNCMAFEELQISASTVGTCNAAVTVTVRDCAQNVSTYTFYTRIDNGAPVMTVSTIPTCYPTVAAAQAAAIAATTITDDCDPYENLTITATTSGTCPATVTVTATDQCGHSRSVAYNGLCIGSGSSVMITNPASNGSSTCENQANALGAWLANHGGATASGSGIVWSYSPDPVAHPELFITNCTTHTKSILVTFKATDGCGYMATTTATFTVSDNTPPTANSIATTNLTCNANIPGPDVNEVLGESDNCGTPTVALYATSDNGASGCPGHARIIIYTYSVTDAYCNAIYVTHTYNIVDNVPPNFTAPANLTINVDAACSYNASIGVTGDVTNESDNCTPSGPGLQAYYTDVVTPGTGFQVKWVITRTWNLTDACGNSAIPRVQTITVKDLINPTLSGCPSNVSLPGSIIGMECGAYAGSLSSPTYSDNCQGASLSYVLTGVTGGSGSGTVPSGTIFSEGVTTVTYTVTDAVGNTAACSFTVTVNCLSISGRIIWEHDGVSGVKDATVKLTQPPAPGIVSTDLSDTNGAYDLSVPAAGTFRVTPVKNINRLNGVTAADATRITNHVNFTNPITNPYKKVCADVNHSGIINTQDATLITQCLAGNPTALAQFNVFWRFTPTDYIMPASAYQNVPVFPEFKDIPVAALDVVGVDFYGMKIGDVDAVWADPQLAPSIPPLVWVVQDQTLVAGTEIDLAFEASNFMDLASYQFALDFDPAQLQFVGFQPLGALPMNLLDNFGAYNANLGELRNVWAVGKGATLADGTPVFRAKFKVLVGGQKLSDVLKLDNSSIECKAYSEALVPTDVKLVFASAVGTNAPLDPGKWSLELMQNHPNPFTDATTIGFILPEACDAHIRILDISGRALANYDRKYTAGYHELDFRMDNAASYGILFCELVTPQGKRTIKMITTH